MNMKPFDLEAAKRGAPIVTRDGRPAKFVAHVPEATELHRVVALLVDQQDLLHFREDGKLFACCSAADLFMAPTKREGWVNLYFGFTDRLLTSPAYFNREDADKAASPDRIACVRVEWEEA